MTSTNWQPFSARAVGTVAPQTLSEGVPDHLELMLRRWIYNALGDGSRPQWVALRLKMTIPDNVTDAGQYLAGAAWSGEELLDIVDAILSLGGPWPAGNPWEAHIDPQTQRGRSNALRTALAEMFDIADSVYRVRSDGNGLARRVDASTAGAIQETVTAAVAKPDAGSAAVHMSTAWDAVHALHPDPPRAYSEAIKAVEAAAHATIEPNNSKATLGTMLGVLKNAPAKFSLTIAGASGSEGIETVTKMMTLLWTGQTSRHGAQTVTRPETKTEAEVAVYLALTLVHWFVNQDVRRIP